MALIRVNKSSGAVVNSYVFNNRSTTAESTGGALVSGANTISCTAGNNVSIALRADSYNSLVITGITSAIWNGFKKDGTATATSNTLTISNVSDYEMIVINSATPTGNITLTLS